MHRISLRKVLVDESVEITRSIWAEELGDGIRLTAALKTQIVEKAVDILSGPVSECLLTQQHPLL